MVSAASSSCATSSSSITAGLGASACKLTNVVRLILERRSLSPKENAAKLRSVIRLHNCPRDIDIMDYAAAVQEASRAVRAMGKEAEQQLIHIDKHGDGPLVDVIRNPDPAYLEAYRASYTDEELIAVIKTCKRPLFLSSLINGNLPGLRLCFEALSPEQRSKIATPNFFGRTAFHQVSLSGNPDNIRFLWGKLSETERAACMRSDNRGDTPLHLAALSGHAAGLRTVTELTKSCGDAAFLEAMKGNGEGYSPFLYALRTGNIEMIRAAAELLKGCDEATVISTLGLNCSPSGLVRTFVSWAGNPATSDLVFQILRNLGPRIFEKALSRDADGISLLHQAAKTRLHDGTKVIDGLPLFSVLRDLDPALLREMLGPDREGRTPFHWVVFANTSKVNLEQILELTRRAGPAAFHQAIQPTHDGDAAIKRLEAYKDTCGKLILDLYRDIKDIPTLAWCIGTFVRNRAWYPLLMRFLETQIPLPIDRLKLLLMSSAMWGGNCFMRSGMKSFLGAYTDFPTALFLEEHPLDLIQYCYPDFFNAIEKRLLSLEAARAKATARRQQEIDLTMGRLNTWSRQLIKSLAGMDVSAAQANALTPYFLRLMDIADTQLRHDLTRTIARYEPFKGDRGARLVSQLGEGSLRRTPLLYHMTLLVLERRGVSPELTAALQGAIAGLGPKVLESGSRGKNFLQALHALVTSTELDAEDYRVLIPKLLDGDVEENLRASYHLLGLGKARQLRADFLAHSPRALPSLADAGFRDLMALPDMEDFSVRFSATFGQCRDWPSLLSYAAGVSGIPETRGDLSRYVEAVLTGKFRELRYAKENNDHLYGMYHLRPDLEQALPWISEDMDTQRVDSLADEGGISFPLGEDKLRDEVFEHDSFDVLRFPHIVTYLNAKTDAERIAVRKTLGQTLAKAKKASHKKVQLELELQQKLIGLCFLTKDPKRRQACLLRARDLASKLEELGARIGPLAGQIEGAIEVLKAASLTCVDDYEVSLSDDFWDLFRVGTDVQGSCQHLRLASTTAKNLMGYVIDGKTLAIVVKKPGDDKIIARRLLRLELEINEAQPCLYLERLYTNDATQKIDAAIVALAKQVAERLQLRLYSKTAPGTPTGVVLESTGSPAHWVYSDAAHGAKQNNGVYVIRGADLLYEPGPAASSSSAAASSSSAAH